MDKSEVVREFYRRQGEQRERDRIIALLESNAHDGWTRGYLAIGLDDAIALIKDDK